MSPNQQFLANAQVKTLSAQGLSCEEIAESLGYEIEAVKAIVGVRVSREKEEDSHVPKARGLPREHAYSKVDEKTERASGDSQAGSRDNCHYSREEREADKEVEKVKDIISDEEYRQIGDALKLVAICETDNLNAKVRAGIYMMEEYHGRNEAKARRSSLGIDKQINVVTLNQYINKAKMVVDNARKRERENKVSDGPPGTAGNYHSKNSIPSIDSTAATTVITLENEEEKE